MAESKGANYLPWFRKKARRAWRATPASKWKRSPWRKRQAGKYRRFNKKHKVVGKTPDYWISPIDAVPYAGPAYSKGKKVYKGQKYARRKARAGVSTVKAGYRSNKSRGRRKTSSPNRRKKPRGTYYYYRGKRYSRR